MQRLGARQPYVPVEAGALVEPALAQRRVHPHRQRVAPPHRRQVGQVEAERGVAAEVLPHILAVEKHHGVAEHAVELHPHALAGRLGRQGEDVAVPAHAGGGVVAPQRLAAVRHQLPVLVEGQLHRPVVRQLDRLPAAVVVVQPRRRRRPQRLGKGALPPPKAQVVGRHVGVAQPEAPAQVQLLPPLRQGCGRRRRCRRGGFLQRGRQRRRRQLRRQRPGRGRQPAL